MRRQQSGIVTVIVVLLLISGVLLVLTQATDLIGNRSFDTVQDNDSAAALMLAESGIQIADAVVNKEQSAGTFSSTTCGNIGSGGPFSVGRGTISFGSATALPNGCGAAQCTSCTVQSTGTVGSAKRTLNATIDVATINGTTGQGQTVTMVLQNTYSVPAIAMFNLAWRRQGSGGNANGTSLTTTGTLHWNLESSNGNPSVGGMATSMVVAANAPSQPVTQVLGFTRDYAEVGGLYPSSSASNPKVIGAYWSNVNSHPDTAQSNGTTGSVYTGFYTSDPTACLTGGTVPNPSSAGNGNTEQACQKWCYDSTSAGVGTPDTLVFGVSARSTSVTDEITSAIFNTNFPFTRLVHFPNTDGSIGAASGKVYAEEWYTYNAPYTSPSVAANTIGATSYDAAIYGQSGTAITLTISPKINNNSTGPGNVSATTGQYCVGDTISDTKIPAGTTISAITGALVGGCTSATGRSITLSQQTTGNVTSATLPSKTFTATSYTSTPLTTSTTASWLNSDGTVGGTLTISTYDSSTHTGTFTAAPSSSINGYVVQGTGLSTTIRLPSTATSANLPSRGTQNDPAFPSDPTHNYYPIVKVYSGLGTVPAADRVQTVDTVNKTFTLASATTVAVIGAQLCGGVCAMFNTPGTQNSTTSFAITKSSGTNQWSSGLMCLSGIDQVKVIPVSSALVKKKTWWESIQ